ncbi:class I SAM-dependent methyltransferase [Campylobacter fetus]|uniref:SAM-dependent methyltransferase n=3 Tax=Campylobacter fetus TaxID=196 RepID=A0AAX0H9F3_CAMFE|nr:class I SAM-dependent methyltransferase [Campylobacter fetus]AGZ82431.1 SAM-dependent methyltransferase [Campylobacter fetus subsp. testudinum 03-427]AJB46153.1 SAM-dependent methyltransferase [Campylobacter fetus subsp. testudinum]ALV65599.1 SAM-dependent methyltransferase [Campylobacter fetus subsp. testudinum Sp3]EAI4322778.1 methyltransferase domain-containing protein [Campylobacter fetus]EAI4392023.1 methyltransferase domain-containing protein [Campylobacter fetus]
MINDLIKASYDEVLYRSNSYNMTCIDRLYEVARMHGLSPRNPDNARVLEIGCASGGNIIGQAVNHPNSCFIGIDLSDEQVKIGKEAICSIGIKNIELITMDICDLISIYKDKLSFDYIIVHGVYSWVPNEVRAAILESSRELLDDDGVALISYNTYPGWKINEITRDFMRFSAVNSDKQDKLQAALNALKFEKAAYASTKISPEQTYQILTRELKLDTINQIEETKDKAYLYHEYLEIFNQPFYLSDFVADLEDFSLSYIADMQFHFSYDEFANQSVKEYAKLAYPDRISKDQMFDFLNSTKFRSSLITKKQNEQKLVFDDDGILKNISDFHLAFSKQLDELKQQARGLDIEPLINSLYNAFPASISIKDACKLINKDELVSKIYYLMDTTNAVILPHKELVDIQYKPKFSKLKSVYKPYLEYFLNRSNSVISCSTPMNLLFIGNHIEIMTLLMLDGQNSLDDISKFLEEEFKKQKLIPNVIINGKQIPIKDTKSKKEFFKNAVATVVYSARINYLLEKID